MGTACMISIIAARGVTAAECKDADSSQVVVLPVLPRAAFDYWCLYRCHVRVYIWHGYLLSGTGSNEYTRALARTLANQGHDVTVFCQDHDAEQHDMAGARVVVPDLPGPLPVFVSDYYKNADAQLLTAMDRETAMEFVAANAEAIRAEGPADLLIANHLLLGGPVGESSGLPYVVKAHGSELEFAMRDRPDLCDWARDSLGSASAVIVGSEHVADVVRELVGIPDSQIHPIPPGVDIDRMRPLDRGEALRRLLAECGNDLPNPTELFNERLPDPGNQLRLAEFFAELGPTESPVVYVGKLSREKGVDLLLHAARHLGLPAVIVGFGPQRSDLEELAGPRSIFTGPLQHRHLRNLWPLMACSVVPSRFPEAFGMVAAEAASCGCPPLVADHSGLAEIASGLAAHYPTRLRDLVSFPRADQAALTRKLAEITAAEPDDWQAMSTGARDSAIELWSWDSVARRILALAADGSTAPRAGLERD